MVQVSEDIFYQVKKEILDKLDLILQKVNLEIINYIKPEEAEFSFIELASFEDQLTHLFHYLDRLYTSLNTEVSFSSIQSYKSTVENYQAENQKLVIENERLKRIVNNLKTEQLPSNGIWQKKNAVELVSKKEDIRQLQLLKREIVDMGTELRSFGRQIRKALKNYKFQMLQSRVEIIAKLKNYEQYMLFSQNNSEKIVNCTFLNCEQIESHANKDGQDIIAAINQILSLC